MTAARAAPAWPPPDDGPPPRRCAYCGEGPQEVLCGLEHSGWTGDVLCQACYAAVCAEVPVLPARGPQQREPEGECP